MADINTPVKAQKSASPKYKIKGSAKSFMMPGFPGAEYTEAHLNGEHGEMIVRAMKKKNPEMFAKLVEEVK